jgi:hypothetical protein
MRALSGGVGRTAILVGPVAFLGGKQAGMRRPGPQPLGIVRPDAGNAIKRVRDPVFRRRHGRRCYPKPLPEAGSDDAQFGQPFVICLVPHKFPPALPLPVFAALMRAPKREATSTGRLWPAR